MNQISANRTPAPAKNVEFDYDNQAWLIDGVYQNCGHLPLTDSSCGCYGRKHQGESRLQDTAVIRAFPCRACKGAGSCSVCHTL